MKTVITPVGTSIFTNYMENNTNISDKYKTLSKNEYKNWRDFKDEEIEDIRRTVFAWAVEQKDAKNISAEIHSLIKLKERYGSFDAYFISSETIEGRLAAEIITKYLEKEKDIKVYFNPEKDVIRGLQVRDAQRFETEGISTLFKRIKEVFSLDTVTKNDDKIINITAGFKGTIPYLSLFGQLYDIPVYYVYEKSEKLIKSPSLPVQFDWEAAESIYPYLTDKRLESLKLNKGMQSFLYNLRLIYHENNNITRTALGELYCDYIEQNIIFANEPLGFIVELKLYKYYNENPYKDKNGIVYQNVKHSVGGKHSNFNSEEIDFVLSKARYDEKGEPFIAIEVKSFLGMVIRNNFDAQYGRKGVLQKLILRLRSFKKFGYFPREYHYVIHMKQKNHQYIGYQFRNNLRKIEKNIKNYFPECITKFFYVNLKLANQRTRPGTNQYKLFIKQDLELNKNFGEIKLD